MAPAVVVTKDLAMWVPTFVLPKSEKTRYTLKREEKIVKPQRHNDTNNTHNTTQQN